MQSISKRKVTSFRLTVLATRQLAELAELLEINNSEIVSIAIDRMYQQESKMSNQYNVWASNDQGATTHVANDQSSIRNCESIARATLGSGWTVHIDKVLYTNDGEYMGKEEVKTFRIR